MTECCDLRSMLHVTVDECLLFTLMTSYCFIVVYLNPTLSNYKIQFTVSDLSPVDYSCDLCLTLQADWPAPMPAIGRIANYSSLRKHRPKEYNIFDAYFGEWIFFYITVMESFEI